MPTTTTQPSTDVNAHSADTLPLSCGCIWDGDTRLQACPAHSRH